MRAEPSIQASKISPALNFGEDVTVEDMQWDEVSHQYYANIGRGWVDIRWLKKVAAVPGGGVPCSTQYDDAFAVAAMGSPTRALLSIIGYAEGTGNCYNVMFGYKTFTSYAQHPNECRPFGNTCSTAAGRYQFLGRTWNEIKRVEGYQTFEPSNQDSGAIYLLQRRGVDNYEQQLSYTELVENLKLMSWEWASFPPGRYGQGFKSFEQMWSKYSQYSNE
ncbi:MAG TPA: glycoside hydrolase family 104 protein [Oligoflexus sp.]|uniref:glycoside hydrolase family 104 protein n=1 Tax=Oligoflexus sp. TaxID=1971216 RepID=UPI002D6F1A73|nr:glycoside hydrolase family 104 protein [Oligoflexus sp.]HYX37174.1 glycoside hydrolase family 104 protein [Oligoflexus sp.]